MATFYLLPSRQQLGRAFADFLHSWFPQLPLKADDLADQLETLLAAAEAYLVFREEIPEGEDIRTLLFELFGAETWDQIYEAPGGLPVMPSSQRSAA
jgi:hypothetical protein